MIQNFWQNHKKTSIFLLILALIVVFVFFPMRCKLTESTITYHGDAGMGNAFGESFTGMILDTQCHSFYSENFWIPQDESVRWFFPGYNIPVFQRPIIQIIYELKKNLVI